MKFNRRDFLGLAAALGVSAAAEAEITFLKKLKPKFLDKIKPPSLKKLDPKFLHAPGRFTFVAINDIHLADAKSTGLINRAIDQIKADNEVKFVVVLGDITSSGQVEEFRLAKQSLDRLDKPYFCIPGNHDCTPGTADPLANFRAACGEPQWVQKDKGWTLIGLDTSEPGQVDGTVSPERIAWLQKVLEHTSESRPIALFTHHPLNPSTKGDRLKNADEVLGLFKGHALKLVASGHFHGNQAEVKDGALFMTTACCASSRGNHDNTKEKGYARIVFNKDQVDHQFVEVQ